MSVHQGDWKLIRIFHGGDHGAHRWKLFNLAEDAGEKNDLADQLPQRVQQMDALIERFLDDTAAVRPTINPRFDPQQYRIEDEGQSRRSDTPQRKAKAAKPVATWRAEKDCELAIAGQQLVIRSSGHDPHLSCRLPKSLPAGEYVLGITMSSTAGGRGQFFWQEQGITPAFFRDRSVTFDVNHDGKTHEYHVRFRAQQPIPSVRLDPGQSRGLIRVQAMSISRDGQSVFAWRFAQPDRSASRDEDASSK